MLIDGFSAFKKCDHWRGGGSPWVSPAISRSDIDDNYVKGDNKHYDEYDNDNISNDCNYNDNDKDNGDNGDDNYKI